jgi:hypothetical protein
MLRDGIAALASRHDRASRAPNRGLTSKVVNRMREKG